MELFKGSKFRKTLVFLVIVSFIGLQLAPTVSAAPPEGKGKGNNQGQAKGKGKSNGQGNSASPNSAQNKSARAALNSSNGRNKVNRTHPHQDRGNRRNVDRDSGADNRQIKLAQAVPQGNGFGPGAGPGIRGLEAAKAHLDSLLKSLNKLEKAKWNHNPKDDRGQGNMGKPKMRDPYGFDKDSGREKSERGRPIRESEQDPVFNLEELVAVDFQIVDWYLVSLQEMLAYYTGKAELYPNSSYRLYVDLISAQINSYSNTSLYD